MNSNRMKIILIIRYFFYLSRKFSFRPTVRREQRLIHVTFILQKQPWRGKKKRRTMMIKRNCSEHQRRKEYVSSGSLPSTTKSQQAVISHNHNASPFMLVLLLSRWSATIVFTHCGNWASRVPFMNSGRTMEYEWRRVSGIDSSETLSIKVIQNRWNRFIVRPK